MFSARELSSGLTAKVFSVKKRLSNGLRSTPFASQMTINFMLIVNKQGLVRVAKYFKWYNSEEKMSMEGELSRRCLARNPGHCSFFHHMVSINSNVVQWVEVGL